MKTYELSYIISSAAGAEETDKTRKEIESFIQGKEGVILRSEKSSPQVLAYPVKRQSSGCRAFLTFQVEEGKIKEIGEKLAKEKDILRHSVFVKRPVRELKKKRLKKSLIGLEKELFAKPAAPFAAVKEKPAEKISGEELDKKIEEILSEQQ